MVGRRNEEAELGRYYQQHYQAFQQYLAQAQGGFQQQAQAQQAPQEPEDWWQEPQWNEAWNRYLVRDSDGEMTLSENTPIEVRQALEKKQVYLQQWQHNLLYKPKEAFKGLMDEIRREIRSEYSQHLETQREVDRRQGEAQTILQKNADWIYQKTADGKPVIDYATGRPALTEAGRFYAAQLYDLQQSGMTDQAKMDQVAQGLTYSEMMRRSKAGPSSNPPAAPGGAAAITSGAGTTGAAAGQPIPAQLKNGRQPQAGGQPGQPKPRRGMSLREKLLAGAKDAPDSDFVIE